jgi:hypothetical protein
MIATVIPKITLLLMSLQKFAEKTTRKSRNEKRRIVFQGSGYPP